MMQTLIRKRSLKTALFPSKMTTIPARLATLTRTSRTPADARKRVLSLYRDWYRSVGFYVVFFGETNQKSHVQFYLL